MPLDVITLPCLTDNYAFIARDEATGEVAAFDVPDGKALTKALKAQGWALDKLFLTHHHWDHVDGIADLDLTHVSVYGAKADAHRLPKLDVALAPGDTISIGETHGTVWDVSGHTINHIAYIFDGHAFSGDSLLAMGCGRLFEGTHERAYASLQRFLKLHDETILYSCHEYTQTNIAFAQSLGISDSALEDRAKQTHQLRSAGKPTVPTTIKLEKATNPFLRAHIPELKAQLKLEGASDLEVFTQMRLRRDSF